MGEPRRLHKGNKMKTKEEIQENIAGSEKALQENLDNQDMFSQGGVMTQDMAAQYEKTRAYIRGWISLLEEKPAVETSNEYTVGRTNAENWLNG